MTVSIDQGISPGVVGKRVTITLVDMGRMVVEAIDNKKGIYHIDMALEPGVVVVPREGDDWAIHKVGSLWKLAHRYERNDDPDPVISLLPGDVRLNGNRVIINGRVQVNGIPLEPHNTIKGETPVGVIDGTNTNFFLQQVHHAGTLEIHVNGLRVFDFKVVSSSEFEFLVAPLENSEIRVDYETTKPAFQDQLGYLGG